MKLTYEEIASLCRGAAYAEITDGGVSFHRFPKEQEDVYRAVSPYDFYPKARGTAGVKIAFKTDSRSLLLAVKTDLSSSRTYFSHDVRVNGITIGSLKNFDDERMIGNYAHVYRPLGDYSAKFSLGDGEKTVEILFPWSVRSDVTALELDDGACFAPSPKPKKLLAYGDSITHGYDVLYTSARYASRLADYLGADEYNRAIAAEIFRPALAVADDGIAPDAISVAYGTNDWAFCPRREFIENCTGFYTAVREQHPDVPVFAITPIWRADCGFTTEFGSFEEVSGVIAEICEKIGGITVLRGRNYVPEDPSLYGDLELHPNDEGNALYFEGIRRDIENGTPTASR